MEVGNPQVFRFVGLVQKAACERKLIILLLLDRPASRRKLGRGPSRMVGPGTRFAVCKVPLGQTLSLHSPKRYRLGPACSGGLSGTVGPVRTSQVSVRHRRTSLDVPDALPSYAGPGRNLGSFPVPERRVSGYVQVLLTRRGTLAHLAIFGAPDGAVAFSYSGSGGPAIKFLTR